MGPWAEGTHGMVFKAFDVKAHINVALKISKRGFEPELENELARLETVHSANQGVFTNIIKPLIMRKIGHSLSISTGGIIGKHGKESYESIRFRRHSVICATND